MKWLRKLAARFLQRDQKGFVINTSRTNPSDVKGWVYGTNWHITFGS